MVELAARRRRAPCTSRTSSGRPVRREEGAQRLRDAPPSPKARRAAPPARARPSRARPSASWSPRLVPASAWISSTTTAPRPAEHRRRVGRATAAAPGFPAWSAACAAGLPAAGRGGWRGVAGAGLDADGQAHLARPARSGCGRCRPPAPSAARRRAVCRPSAAGASPGRPGWAGSRPGSCRRRSGRPAARISPACAASQQRKLVRPRRPAARGEPAGEGFRQCSHPPRR